jgi:hypothetical protein
VTLVACCIFLGNTKYYWCFWFLAAGEIYLAFFNLDDSTSRKITARISDLQKVLGTSFVRTHSCSCTDAWSGRNLGLLKEEISAVINPHGSAVFELMCWSLRQISQSANKLGSLATSMIWCWSRQHEPWIIMCRRVVKHTKIKGFDVESNCLADYLNYAQRFSVFLCSLSLRCRPSSKWSSLFLNVDKTWTSTITTRFLRAVTAYRNWPTSHV